MSPLAIGGIYRGSLLVESHAQGRDSFFCGPKANSHGIRNLSLRLLGLGFEGGLKLFV